MIGTEDSPGRMSIEEFQRWKVFARIEPIGGARSDYIGALIATTIANVFSKSKIGLEDFLVDFWEEAKGIRSRTGPDGIVKSKAVQQFEELFSEKIRREQEVDNGRDFSRKDHG